MCEGKPVLLLTGFGPFTGNPVNASWEAVRHVNKNEIQNKFNIELIQEQIPVAYKSVDNTIPKLWNIYKPKLVIHVGVANGIDCLRLESVANKNHYELLDINNECPANYASPAKGAPTIHTKLNVEKISREFHRDHKYDNYRIELSTCAGSYLCEYIFYTSLCCDNTRTLFVHVPDLDTYTSEQAARGLERVIELCMKQINMKQY